MGVVVAKKIIVREQKHGCIWLFCMMLLLCVVIAALAFVGSIAAGVGLWFLIRYIWRFLVRESPDSKLVVWGMRQAPIARKALAAVPCVVLSLALLGAFANSTATKSKEGNAGADAAQQEQKAENPKTEEKDPEPEAPKLDDLKATFIDVGQGDSEFLQLPDGKTMLIDAGEVVSGSTVVDHLKGLGVKKIDYLVGSHPHSDHVGGLADVIDEFDIGEVWIPDASEGTEVYGEFLDAVEAKGCKVKKAEAGETFVGGDAGYEINVIGPKADAQSEDMNDYSVVLRVTYGDTSMLFTGDAAASDIVADNPGHVDVLKAAHHGSETGTSDDLMSSLSPSIVVLSYGEGNDYGHPSQSTLDAIAAVGAESYGTAVNGNITVTSDGKTVKAQTAKSGTVVAGMSAEERQRQEEEAAETKAQQEAAAAAEAQQETVYITPMGKKYHRKDCRTLNRTKNPTPISKQDAIDQGLEACKVCHP